MTHRLAVASKCTLTKTPVPTLDMQLVAIALFAFQWNIRAKPVAFFRDQWRSLTSSGSHVSPDIKMECVSSADASVAYIEAESPTGYSEP
ncbi:hypothetical protein AB0758_47260 [Tolypothrix bouteillei VB521301_2]|uniref:hypothetical protein n=1 Tax=Tolypothrix bouteillei TaxID=1246981 RepID=UPI0038B47D56